MLEQYKYKPNRQSKGFFQFIQGITTNIKTFLKSEHSFIFIPDSTSKSHSISISNRTLVFISLSLVVLFALGIYTSFSVKPWKDGLAKSKEADKKALALLEGYKQTVSRLEKEVDAYYKDIENLYSVSGNALPTAPDKIEKEYSSLNYEELPDEALTLTRLSEELEHSREHIKDIASLISLRTHLLNSIPSSWPIKDGVGQRTSSYGPRYSPFTGTKSFHTGVDIAHRIGTSIVATADGTVVYAGYRGAYGYTVIIKHKFGYRTVYSHNYRLTVKENQKVRKGQVIAKMGQSGRATGPHLHYEIRLGSRRVDPWPYLTIQD